MIIPAKKKVLTDAEMKWLDKLEKQIDRHWKELNDWEKKFIEDLLERYKQYGKDTIISAKQWEKITDITDKVIA